MKRRILSLLLVLVFAMSFLSLGALADDEPELWSAGLVVFAPMSGGLPSNSVNVTSPHCTASVQRWSTPTHEVSYPESFAVGVEYTVTLEVRPEEGFYFADGAVFYINGEAASAAPDGTGGYVVSRTFPPVPPPEEVSSVSITVDVPVAGAHPDMILDFPDDSYEVTEINWWRTVGGEALSESDVFAQGVSYTVYLEIHIRYGYFFAEDAEIRINGQAAQDVDYAGEYIYAGLNFPPAERDVWKIHFDPNGGMSGTWEWAEVAKGETLTLPECPYGAPEGMVFASWDAGAPGTVIEVTGDMEIKALWTSDKQNVWKVHFDPNGGMSGTWEWVEVAKGETLTLPECPYGAPEGMAFARWDAGMPGEVIEVSGDMEIKALWTDGSGEVVVIDSAAVTVDAPVPRMQSASSADAADGGYYAVRVDWSWNPFDTNTQYVFEEGVAYTVRVMLAPAPGYSFAEDLTGTVNGVEATVTYFDEQTVGLSITFPETPSPVLHSAAAVVDIPVAGLQSADTARVPAGAYYSATSVVWSWNPFDTNTQYVFEEGVAYSVRVMLTPAPGCSFAEDLTGTVNGMDATVTYWDEQTVGLSITFPETAPKALTFTDVPEKTWYAEDVRVAYATGLINGKSATSFAPTANITYAETVKLAACMHQLYLDGTVSLANGKPWYASYVDYAKTNGIITQDYDWNAQATRADFVAIFAAALPREAFPAVNGVPKGTIPDVSADHPQAASIYLFYRAGILTGYPTAGQSFGEFRPDRPITRAEVAAILSRMMNSEKRIAAAG